MHFGKSCVKVVRYTGPTN